ncbi:hypothetical protein C8D92_101362 [Tamilnaduibacter salinus]|uniref:DUF4124 domain-containing protein n=1 Tax=Tamilnaduibacter salinus TaxID=1484056 RepID=A0A2U1D187_9GAMM|nr:DUF4124 domain-containing protein [Tamilnaduibacter salinus]PVY79155.1 hypothetical protein C8D92_101362 [Tamilnaduibacter salinus]
MKGIRLLAVAALLPLTFSAQAQIYKCVKNDKTQFSDEPCGDNAEKVEAEAALTGGTLSNENTEGIDFYERERKASQSQQAPCPHIQSTRLKRLIIQNKVVSGMKPDDVRRAWRHPDSIHSGGASTQWAYHWADGSDNYVYFENGCVSDLSSYADY